MARRVFFSFHYQDVIDFRANVPRNSWLTQKREAAGFFDASIWESTKKSGEAALKRLIHGGLENTSVTTVLIGSETCLRPWVRYEIIRSLFRGNHLLGIHINGITGRDKSVKSQGSNPFEYLALQYSTDGRQVIPMEWNGTAWIVYARHDAWPLQTVANRLRWGQTVQISQFSKTYDWVANDGYKNFATWVGN